MAPLSPWLDRSDITDIMVNRPGEVWIESASGLERIEAPAITELMLQRLAQQIAASSSQGVSREHPLLAATLPDGARVQLAGPPATRGTIALAIRKHVVPDLTLEDYEAAGAFRAVDSALQPSRSDIDARLDELLQHGDLRAFFALAVRARRNIVISGGTASGKTTFLNALLKETPATDRVIVIEDTAEVTLTQPNSVGLVAVKSELGESQVGVDDLLRASLRMRPDRLMVGEIRGAEAFTFLRAVNTGHPGSFTTVHADSPEGALEQIAFMSLQSGLSLTRSDIRDYARSVLDIVVQLTRINGRRMVERVMVNRRV
ncbi:MAG: P-type DNA transfer ATPase VirB11 [Alphaproteobacteria bacterium]|nr:P-type DNA transfer ATPase VirB11 [Alphaproteobacteria bacterium]